MNLETVLASVLLSAIISAVVSYLVSKAVLSRNGEEPHDGDRPVSFLKNSLGSVSSFLVERLSQSDETGRGDDSKYQDSDGNPRKKDPEEESETTPQHSQVLRRVASDMKSQLKTFKDYASRDPQPIKIPNLSEMALWQDLVMNHLQKEYGDFSDRWIEYRTLLKEHSELEAKIFREIEGLVKSNVEGFNAQHNENILQPPPLNVARFNSGYVGTIMKVWLNSIRNLENSGKLEITHEDAKKSVKAPGYEFLIVNNEKVAIGEEEAVNQLEKTIIQLTTDFSDSEVFKRYEEAVQQKEQKLLEQRTVLENVLTISENTDVFKGKCQYS